MQDRLVQNWGNHTASFVTEKILNWKRDKCAVLGPPLPLSLELIDFSSTVHFLLICILQHIPPPMKSDFKTNTCEGAFRIKATGTGGAERQIYILGILICFQFFMLWCMNEVGLF